MTPAIRERWLSISPRERRMVSIAAWVLGFGVLIGLVIEPAWTNIVKLRAELPALRAQAATVAGYAQEARRLGGVAPTGARGGPLKGDVEKSLQRANITVTPAAITGTDEQLQIKLTAVNFSDLSEWLGSVQKELRVKVSKANVTRGAESGKVSATFSLDAVRKP
jgi:general secretion pathway protein M